MQSNCLLWSTITRYIAGDVHSPWAPGLTSEYLCISGFANVPMVKKNVMLPRPLWLWHCMTDQYFHDVSVNLLLKSFLYDTTPRCWQVCLGLKQTRTYDISYIKLSVPLYRIWTQQRINSKITYRCKNLKLSQNYLVIFQKIHTFQNWLYACKSWCKCIFQYQFSVSYHEIFTEVT